MRRERFAAARILSHSHVLLCAQVCKLLRAWGWFTANWFVNVVFVSFKNERETRISVFLACMIRYTIHTALVCILRVRASENTGNFYQPHLIIAAETFSLCISLISFSLSSVVCIISITCDKKRVVFHTVFVFGNA